MKFSTRNIVGGILLLGGAYFIYKYYYDKKKKPAGIEGLDTPAAPVTKPQPSSQFPLKKGSKGDKVIELQTVIFRINPNLLPKFGVDGDFGSETEAAVLRLLGKRTVDSQSDINKIISDYQSKNPLVPKTPKVDLPTFKLF